MATELKMQGIRLRLLDNGKVEVKHPSGVAVDEDWDKQEAQLLEARDRAQERLDAFRACYADVKKLAPVSIAVR